MAQSFTYYPLGNAQTMLLKLGNGKKVLFDFANVKTDDASDKRWNIEEEFEDYDNIDAVMFTHAHEDHIKGSAEFFRGRQDHLQEPARGRGKLLRL